jgi:hypothetical protein
MDSRIKKLIEETPAIKFNDFSVSVTDVNLGIFFMYTAWSLSFIQLITIVNSLENFPHIKLWVFDTDVSQFDDFKKRNLLYSDGWGETFWIKSSKVVFELKKYNSENIETLIHYNSQIS